MNDNLLETIYEQLTEYKNILLNEDPTLVDEVETVLDEIESLLET